MLIGNIKSVESELKYIIIIIIKRQLKLENKSWMSIAL